jgi:hypothetical protein
VCLGCTGGEGTGPHWDGGDEETTVERREMAVRKYLHPATTKLAIADVTYTLGAVGSGAWGYEE